MAPDNVVKFRKVEKRQDFFIKEKVNEVKRPAEGSEQYNVMLQNFRDLRKKLSDAGVSDFDGNLMFGTTKNNLKPRWILIE